MWIRSAELHSNHVDLSSVDWRFREYVLGHDDCLRRSSYAPLDRAGKLILATLQPWPAFISKNKLHELADACRGVARLLRRIPTLAFDDDPEAIARFYGFLDADLVRRFLEEPSGMDESLTRGDFIYDDEGFRMLELNFSPSLGGWESSVARRLHLEVPSTRRFFEREGLEFETTDTMEELYEHVASEVLERLDPTEPVRLAYSVPDWAVLAQSEEAQAWVDDAWSRVLDRRGLDGSATVCTLDDLTVDGERLLHDGEPVHALIYAGNHAAAREHYRLFKRGGFCLFNGPLEGMLSDKRNLALLSDLADRGRLDPDDRDTVDRHVPWTRILDDEETPGPDGETVSPLDYALDHRTDVVIKEASSFGSRGVVLGEAEDDDAWRAAVERAHAEGDWVVQKRVVSRKYLFQTGEDGCALHEVIWGPFLFGERYGGLLLRMHPQDFEGAVSVTRTGASAGFVAEVEP